MASDEEIFTWSDREITPSYFYDNMDLPAVVLVRDGFCGDTPWETLSCGDVIYLESRQKQARAVAVRGGNSSHYYSIPIDYPVPFMPLDDDIAEEMPLQSILQTQPLPCRVALSSSGSLCYKKAGQTNPLPLGSLVIKDTYDEKFFRGFSILQGNLFNEPIAIPIHLKVKFSNAINLNVDAFDKSPINQNTTNFFGRLRYFKEASSMIKQAIVPTDEITVFEGSPPENEGVYDIIQPSYITLRKRGGEEHPYEKLKKTSSEEKCVDELKHKLSSIARHKTAITRRPQLPLPTPSRPIQLVQPLKNQLLEQMKNLKKVTSPSPKSPKPDSLPVRELSQPDESTQGESGYLYPTPNDLNQVRTQTEAAYESSELRSHSAEEAGSNPNENQPTSKTDDNSSEPVGGQANTSSVVDRIREMRDVRCASLDDIVGCLGLLNLSALIPVFKENQIDGELLWELDEEIMKTDLGMSSFQARKLWKFVNEGWRPVDWQKWRSVPPH